jgi:hypothetical protein
MISKSTVTTPGDNIGTRWEGETIGVGFNPTYSITAVLSRESSNFNQEVTVMTGQDHHALNTVPI